MAIPLPDLDVNPKKPIEDSKLVKRGRPADSKVKRERFAYLYALRGDLSGKQCAIDAGYAASSAASTATALLKEPDIQLRIKVLQETTPHYVVRKPKRVREKLYSEYYELLYRQMFDHLLSQMGWQEREFVMRRQDLTLKKKWRVQANQDYNVIHKQCVKYANEYCTKMFGPVNRKKPRYDKMTKKMQYRSVKGCAYFPKYGDR